MTGDWFAAEVSRHSYDIVQLPGLVEERLQRAVEAEDREPALAGNGPDPVLLLRLIRAEVDVDRAVGIDLRVRCTC